ncbi:MAG: hypothetical protein BWX95_02354 [Bacteroidetes bacterium ADurb.Bin141]|nr:MAG: hypothetical protein BWX95_02354 [Bacteroidetes bacterium ADurb.Bin141]
MTAKQPNYSCANSKKTMWGIKLLIADGGYRGELIEKAKIVFK